MRLLAVTGSLRSDSLNRKLLRAAQELAPPGVEWETFEELHTIPPFAGDRTDDDAPHPVHRWRDALAAADGVLFVTPEYNGSIPGTLKNAIDWASVPFPDNALRGVPVMVMGASTGGYGGMWAHAELRKVLGITGARVLDGGLSLARAHEAFDGDGRLLGASQAGRLAELMRELADQPARIAA